MDAPAMVSRIRVEVRGATMEAAEQAAFLVLEHARAAGHLEGVVHNEGDFTDHHFLRPNVTRKFGEGPEPWSELGLPYEGRLAFTFKPGSVLGGVAQSGFEVTQVDNFIPFGLYGHPDSDKEPVRTDVTDKVMVLHRVNEVQRDHDLPQAPPLLAEEMIENFEVYVTRDYEQAVLDGWTPLRLSVSEWGPTEDGHPQVVATRLTTAVMVSDAEAAQEIERLMETARTYVSGILSEREMVAKPVLHSGESLPMSRLKVGMLANALRVYPYRTLIVGSPQAMIEAAHVRDQIAQVDTGTLAGDRARELSVHFDEDHHEDKFSLTTEVVN